MSISTFPSHDGSLPYVSQWGSLDRNDEVVMRRAAPSGLDVFLRRTDPSHLHDWASDGYHSREEYLFWSRKVCGLACLQSLLHGWTDIRLPMRELLASALDRGCYVVDPRGKVQADLPAVHGLGQLALRIHLPTGREHTDSRVRPVGAPRASPDRFGVS